MENEKTTRDKNGRFTKGNTIGKETRFLEGNDLSLKYRDEMCDMMIQYFKTTKDFPTFEEFAGEILDVDEQTLANWRESHPRFRITYDKCRTIQKGKLVKGGVTGAYNAAFSKFMAVNCYGMTDKSESDSKVSITVTTNAEVDEESN